jgi:hypothetical protein
MMRCLLSLIEDNDLDLADVKILLNLGNRYDISKIIDLEKI